MAIDSAQKRASALNFTMPFRHLPYPDSSIDQGDRQHMAGLYAGVLAGVLITFDAAPVPTFPWWIFEDE